MPEIDHRPGIHEWFDPAHHQASRAMTTHMANEPTSDESRLHQLRQWETQIGRMARAAGRGNREVLGQRAALLRWAIRRIEGAAADVPTEAELAEVFADVATPCPEVLEVDLSGHWRAEVT